MVVFKASTLAIVFVVIDTVRYCSATNTTGKKKCEELLEEKYKTEGSDGLENFREAHNNPYIQAITKKLKMDDDHPESSDNLSESSETQEMKKCVELLKEEFDSGDTDGLKNFKESYKNTSVEEMRKKFNINEILSENLNPIADEESLSSVLKFSVSVSYFSCLTENSGIDIEIHGILPLDFCRDEAEKLQAELNNCEENDCEGKYLSYDELFNFCKIYISKFGFSTPIEEITSKKYVFEHLYEEWSLNMLKYEIFIQLHVDIQTYKETDKMKRLLVGRFVLGYFKSYGQLVENVGEGQGNFKSISAFCCGKGEKIVKVVLNKNQ